MRLEARENLGAFHVHSKVEVIWKSPDARAPDFATDLLKLPWRGGDALQHEFQLIEKVPARPWSPNVIPVQDRRDIALGSGRKDNRHQR